uniref:ABC transporter subunit C n=1 Tax=Echinosophora koreensis TaxID=228658 RepID=UPI002410FADC|nr:ABC transporter subunit C [Echinosophora koreensis]WEG94159.1 ABC transporter subunit C [Echinosophora koreensis]
MSISLLQPSFLMSKTRSYALILIGSRLFLTAMAIHLSLRVAPLDLQQGGNSRILYVHVPAARMSILVYIATAINTLLFLLTKHPLFLRSSGTGTEMGAFFTLFTLVTGGFRGRPMWGTFWVWDARLTSVFISFLIYLGALRFQKLPVEPAPISIRAGPIDIPIIKSSVNWWNTLHQPGSISRSGTSIHVPMPIPILSNFANFPLSTRILFVLETRLPILSFLESPLRDEIEARVGRGIPNSYGDDPTSIKGSPGSPLPRLLTGPVGLVSLLPLLIHIYFPVDQVDRLWFFSLYASGGTLFAMLEAKTLPTLVMGWVAGFIGHFFIFLCLGRNTVAGVYFLFFLLVIGSLLFFNDRITFLLKNNRDTILNLVIFAAYMGVYIGCLLFESLTKNMLEHAQAVCLIVLSLYVLNGFRHILLLRKPFILLTLALSLLPLFAWLAPGHPPGGIGPILFFLLPFKGAAALFVLFRAKTLPEQIMGCAAFNGSLLLILFLLGLLPFVKFLSVLLLFVLILLLGGFLQVKEKEKFKRVLYENGHILFLANVGLSVLLFTYSIVDKSSSIYEHCVALSSLITFVYLFKFASSIICLYYDNGKDM